MKRNIITGIALIAAAAFSSCATTQIASNHSDSNDDVYYSKAKAGDLVVHAAPSYKTDDYAYADDYDSNYFIDDSYAARINRFSYYTPWRGYYDNLWFSSGYYSAPYLYSGIGLGFGFSYSPWSWAYSPFNSYGYYGYSPYAYSPYSYYGVGYGSPYWGVYSYYRPAKLNANYGPRPSRGSENAGYINANRGTVRVGPDGRAVSVGRGTTTTNTVRPTRTSTVSTERPTRTESARPGRTETAPAPRPATVERSGSGSSSSPASSGGGGGGGGARPTRSGSGR